MAAAVGSDREGGTRETTIIGGVVQTYELPAEEGGNALVEVLVILARSEREGGDQT